MPIISSNFTKLFKRLRLENAFSDESLYKAWPVLLRNLSPVSEMPSKPSTNAIKFSYALLLRGGFKDLAQQILILN
jgi:hypothetical protein